MASSSRLVSDEDLQKAKDGSEEQINPGSIPSSNEEDKKNEEKDKTGKKKKKKKIVLPKKYVEMLLNYECRSSDHKNIDRLAEEDEERYGYYKTLVTEADEIGRRYDDTIREYQERLRRVIETRGIEANGYVSYEVTDNEGEDDNEGVTTSQLGPRGRGRRRHRPGIMKQAGRGVKKLN